MVFVAGLGHLGHRDGLVNHFGSSPAHFGAFGKRFGVILARFGVMFGSWAAICGSRDTLGAQSGEIFSPTPLFWRSFRASKTALGGYVLVFVCLKTFDRVLDAKIAKTCKKVDDLGSASGAKNLHSVREVCDF